METAKLICIQCNGEVGTLTAPYIEEGIEPTMLCGCGGEITKVLVRE